ncbi:MAG TPA: type I DNA topoisomerase [bacterium]|nr:type I DNA topoisomerase [bacterium]
MKKNFIIVESPTKAKTLNKFLKGEYLIEASMGHIRDLPLKRLGVAIEGDNFIPEYELSQRGKKIADTLKREAAKCDVIFLATDPDREGEAIAWHLYEILKKINSNILRIEFHEITKKAITHAIDNASHINIDRVNAQQARRILDRIVGYKLSPLLWQIISKGLSAGRVQSVAVRIICDREEEIQNFKPEEFWKIKVWLLTESKDPIEFELAKIDNKKAKIPDETTAANICEALLKAQYSVDKISRRKQLKNPLPPLITSKIQQMASAKFNYSPDRTMKIAQQLYEGVPVSDNEVMGLITYMRTDSIRIADEAKQMAADFIKETYGEKYLPVTEREFKQKTANVQDAHEAIRPTDVSKTPEKLEKFLSKEQYKIYKLIWDVFVSSQMKPAEFDVTTILVSADKKYLFTAKGSILVFDGFLKVFQPDSQKDVILPNIKDNESLAFEKLEKSQHFTKPPARYTEATLVKELEDKGIGRPSTYASIVSTILNRKYVYKENKVLIPSELGKIVNKFLVSKFNDVVEIGFTADMETKLDKVEKEGYDWQKLLKEFYIKFENDISLAARNIKVLKNEIREETNYKCEKCGSVMLLKFGTKGKFLACSKFPECKNTKPVVIKGSEIEILEDKILEEKCPQCGNNLKLKNGRFGKFITCSNYPECKYAKNIDTGIPCLKEGCSGKLVKRQIKKGAYKGKYFYGCSNYPKCSFAEWKEPVLKKCQKCQNKYLVVASKSEDGIKLKCPIATCDYTEIIPENEYLELQK